MNLREPLLRHRLKIGIVLLSLVSLAWLVHAHQDALSKEAFIEFGKQIPSLWFMVLFLILPLIGFPISVCLVLAGIQFGFGGGMAVAVVAVVFHNFAAYRLAHGLFRARMRGFLEKAGYAIPPIDVRHRVRFTALFSALRGPPYIVKLYLLALTDIPFRTYFRVGVPINVFFSAISVAVGSAATTMHVGWIYFVLGGFAFLTLAGYWLKWRRRVDSPVADQCHCEDGKCDAE